MQWLARETGTTSPHGRPMKDRGALCFTPVALVSKVAIPNAIARREAIARPFGRSQSRQDSKFRFGSNGPHGFGRLTTGKRGGQQRVPGGMCGKTRSTLPCTAGGADCAGTSLSRKGFSRT